jgi:hypothetical protein
MSNASQTVKGPLAARRKIKRGDVTKKGRCSDFKTVEKAYRAAVPGNDLREVLQEVLSPGDKASVTFSVSKAHSNKKKGKGSAKKPSRVSIRQIDAFATDTGEILFDFGEKKNNHTSPSRITDTDSFGVYATLIKLRESSGILIRVQANGQQQQQQQTFSANSTVRDNGIRFHIHGYWYVPSGVGFEFQRLSATQTESFCLDGHNDPEPGVLYL